MVKNGKKIWYQEFVNLFWVILSSFHNHFSTASTCCDSHHNNFHHFFYRVIFQHWLIFCLSVSFLDSWFFFFFFTINQVNFFHKKKQDYIIWLQRGMFSFSLEGNFPPDQKFSEMNFSCTTSDLSVERIWWRVLMRKKPVLGDLALSRSWWLFG